MPKSIKDISLGRMLQSTATKGEITYGPEADKNERLRAEFHALSKGKTAFHSGRDRVCYVDCREFLTRADVGGGLFAQWGSYDVRPVSSIASFSALFRAGGELITDLKGQVYPISTTFFPALAAGVLNQTLSGTTAVGSAAITALPSTTGLVQGMTVTGTGIPAGAVIVSVDSTTQVTISIPATAAATVSITFASNPDGTYPAVNSQPAYTDRVSSPNNVPQLVAPIRATASFSISNQLLEISTPVFEQVIKKNIAKAVSSLLDWYGLFGTGTNGQPFGIWSTITPNALGATPLTYQNFLDYRRTVEQANIETATGLGVILSPLMKEYCDITSAFGNTYSILDRMRDGVDRIVTAPEITAGGIAGAKVGIIGNFDAVKLLVWGIETVWNPYVFADQFKTRITINVLMNTAILLPSAIIGWNQN